MTCTHKSKVFHINGEVSCKNCSVKFHVFDDDILNYVDKNKATQDTSDGYHTFEELYEHRMALFSVICNSYPHKAWKSKLHDDGTMYKDYFIVGVSTSEGDYSYHYHLKHWDNFKVKEIPKAPKWDGHKPHDYSRLFTLVEEIDQDSPCEDFEELFQCDYCKKSVEQKFLVPVGNLNRCETCNKDYKKLKSINMINNLRNFLIESHSALIKLETMEATTIKKNSLFVEGEKKLIVQLKFSEARAFYKILGDYVNVNTISVKVLDSENFEVDINKILQEHYDTELFIREIMG